TAIFSGATINTPSLLCVEDYLDALAWGRKIGGLKAMIARSMGNLAAISAWVEKNDWVEFLAHDEATRSNTSICLRFAGATVERLDDDGRAAFAARVAQLLDDEDVGYDVNAYRSAPPGLRIWGGATVERSDVEALLPWIDWAYAVAAAEVAA
ncbi:MAG: phosphoserine transaminase, partial [Gammaproteobacteria bacterium]